MMRNEGYDEEWGLQWRMRVMMRNGGYNGE